MPIVLCHAGQDRLYKCNSILTPRPALLTVRRLCLGYAFVMSSQQSHERRDVRLLECKLKLA